MPGATNSFLLLVAMPFFTSSVLSQCRKVGLVRNSGTGTTSKLRLGLRGNSSAAAQGSRRFSVRASTISWVAFSSKRIWRGKPHLEVLPRDLSSGFACPQSHSRSFFVLFPSPCALGRCESTGQPTLSFIPKMQAGEELLASPAYSGFVSGTYSITGFLLTP